MLRDLRSIMQIQLKERLISTGDSTKNKLLINIPNRIMRIQVIDFIIECFKLFLVS